MRQTAGLLFVAILIAVGIAVLGLRSVRAPSGGSPAVRVATVSPAKAAAPSPALDMPDPTLRPVTPAWPTADWPLARPRLPAPEMPLAVQPTADDEALIEPASTRPAPESGLRPGSDPAFAEELLGLRRAGLEAVFLVQQLDEPRKPAWRIHVASAAAHHMFPQARFGVVVYSPAGLRVLPLGADADAIRSACETPLPADRPAGEATGLADAMAAAAGMAWSPGRRRLALIVAAVPPWIAETPAIRDAARHFAQSGGVVHLITLPAPRPVEDLSSFDRLAAGGDVSRTDLHDVETLAQEVLTRLVGEKHRARSERLLHALAD